MVREMFENPKDYDAFLILKETKGLVSNINDVEKSTFLLMCLQEAKEQLEKILTGASNDSVNN